MSSEVPLQLVYCESRLLLTKRSFEDWRQIQAVYPDYKTSLGPWTATQIIDYFPLDYGDNDTHWPFSRDQILKFLQADCETITQAD